MSRIKAVLGFAMGLAFAVSMLPADTAQAQSNYPNRPIRIIVPYPAGGIVDIVARAVTEQVGRDWKQTVVVEARPGGNSNIGTASVARSEPDGYTWLVTGPAALVNPTLYKDAGWDAMRTSNASALRSGIKAWRWCIRRCPPATSRNSSRSRARSRAS